MFARILPTDRATGVGRRLMMGVGPKLEKQRIVRRNLALAFPHKNEREIEELAASVWGNVGSLLVEYGHLDDICVRDAEYRLEIASVGEVPVLENPEKPSVFVSAHLANWEVCAIAIHRVGIPVTAVYTPLQNPYLDRMLMRRREALGCRLVPRDASMRALLRAADEPDPQIIGEAISRLSPSTATAGMPNSLTCLKRSPSRMAPSRRLYWEWLCR